LLKSTEPYAWRRRIVFRILLLVVVAVFIILSWWPIPWSVYAAFTVPSLLLYTLMWWRQALQKWLGWTHVIIDLTMLALLVRHTGGVFSPFDNLAYIWFFGMVLLYMRRAQTTRLPFFSVLAFLALTVGAWGFPNWVAYLGFHALGLALAALLGVTLLAERSRNLVDPLTRVFHRRAGLERVNDKLKRGLPFALAFIDLRGFKAINDSYGHAVGDEVIYTVAKRIANELRQDDVVLRYGGDEFVVVSEAAALSSRLEQLFLSPIQTSSGAIQVQADVGEVNRLPEEPLESLLTRADEAMYRNKGEAYRREMVPRRKTA
jgi:diguanylate cyclase (GGDEF)-like protein